MGECDRFKNYISDYLDNALDPTTQKEFEKALDRSEELRKMTHKVSMLKTRLSKLTSHTCSDDFSLKLRERIHTEPQPLISRQNIVRFSFAFSFILIIAIVTISLTVLSDSPDIRAPIQNTSDFQNQVPTSNPTSGNTNSFNNEGEVDVKTIISQEAVQDSSQLLNNKIPERRTKQVDQKN